jgi:homoserine dehydrogenase
VTLAALRAGKTVVSANKALLCEHGQEVLDAARENRGAFFFEASVAGGIPIIKALQEGLVANRFGLIYGILNGTCNYILTRMEREGLSYPEILADAKRLGYAEADETLDVEGWDTAHKAAVLAHLAHGRWVSTDEMIVQGISAVSQSDIRRARELGYVIKLLALIERDFRSNSLSVRVHPTLVPTHHVLANVNEVYNGISVAGDVAGTTFYIGRGAGQDATASAVISDIVDAASQLLRGPAARPGAGAQEPLPSIACASTICSEFYLRLLVADAPGVLAQIASLLAKQQISIASVLQKPADASAKAAELFLTTHSASEAAIATAVTELAGLPSVLSKPALIRIGSF